MISYRSIVYLLICLSPAIAHAQRLSGTARVTRSQIGDERVQRQTEVMRLQGMVEGLKERMVRMERQELRSSRFPAISIAEAEAAIEYAKLRLEEAEYEFDRGEASKSRVAGDRLALVRAESQLETAKNAHTENLIVLELEVAYAQRQLFEASQETKLNERFAAKGYASTDRLRYAWLDRSVAEKQLKLAKLRLAAQQKAAGIEVSTSLLPDEANPQESSDEATSNAGELEEATQ